MSRWLGLIVTALLLVPPHAFGEGPSWDTLQSQAESFYKEKRIPEAVRLAEEAAAAAEREFGPNHINAAIALDGMITMYRVAADEARARYLRSISLLEQALAVAEKANGPDDPIVAGIRYNLAMLYHAQRRYAEAEPLYQRSLTVWEHLPEPDTIHMASVCYQLAELYEAQDRHTDAEAARSRASTWLSEPVPSHSAAPDVVALSAPPAAAPAAAPEAPQATPVPADEGAAPKAAEDPVAAELKWKLAALEESLGPDHPAVATILTNLGQLYAGQSRDADAEPYYERALAIDEKAFGETHETVAKDMSNLAELYRRQARYAAAEAAFAKLLAVLEQIVDEKHPDIGRVLDRYAECLEQNGKPRDAKTVRARAKKLGF